MTPTATPTPEDSPAARADPLLPGSERWLRLWSRVAESSADLVAVVAQPSYQIEYLNPAGRRILRLPGGGDGAGCLLMEWVSNQSLWTLLNDATPGAWRAGSWSGELEFRRADGDEIPVSATLISQPAADGYPECLILTARDTTEMHRKLNALRRDQRYLRALLENLPDIIYFKDLESRFLRVNHAFSVKFGVTDPEKLIGKSDFDYFSEEHAREAYDGEQQIIRSEKPLLNVEERETWSDGRITWCATTKLPFYNEYGQVIGTFGITRDITARKHAEAALAESQRRLIDASRMAGMAEVASGVLHNVGNAFNSVNTSASLISDQLRGSRMPNLAKAVSLLEDNAAQLGRFLQEDTRGKQLPVYLGRLTRELLREREILVAETETLRTGIDHIKAVIAMQQNYAHASTLCEKLVLQEIIEEALVIASAALERGGVVVDRQFSPMPLILAARHRVLEILVNLINNAQQAIHSAQASDPRITFVTAVEGPWVELRVRDNGMGISPENLQRIFSFGFTTKKEGHGFGLHNSALAAREMGGQLFARSDGPGLGAEFVLRLPVATG